MSRAAKRFYFSVRMPSEMVAEIDKIRQRQGRTRCEVLEEALRLYFRKRYERGL